MGPPAWSTALVTSSLTSTAASVPRSVRPDLARSSRIAWRACLGASVEESRARFRRWATGFPLTGLISGFRYPRLGLAPRVDAPLPASYVRGSSRFCLSTAVVWLNLCRGSGGGRGRGRVHGWGRDDESGSRATARGARLGRCAPTPVGI